MQSELPDTHRCSLSGRETCPSYVWEQYTQAQTMVLHIILFKSKIVRQNTHRGVIKRVQVEVETFRDKSTMHDVH